MQDRKSGILLHISSLPSAYGIGDLGPAAYQFADFLHQARQRLWQILPLNPTTVCNSPYNSPSAFAFNPLFISPELMVRDGLIQESELHPVPKFPESRVDYSSVITYKIGLFKQGYEKFKCGGPNEEYEKFCWENGHWLHDYALFTALKSKFNGRAWYEWPHEIKNRHEHALETCSKELHEKIEEEKFLQFLFFRQWSELNNYCREKDVRIFGDVSIYVTWDSADVWAHPEIFKLDEEKNPWVVAGVPPDYFSKTGQLWGNPLYNWDVLRERNYEWWIQRMEHNLRCFDLARLDHFRGFVAAWEVPANDKTAEHGRWVDAPAMDFFTALTERISSSSIVAEDLGHITPDVREVMRRFGFPGMKLLVFAFGEGLAENPYAPHNHEKNCVLYTGTHDCNTIKGWFENELTEEDKERLFHYLGRKVSGGKISREMIRLAMMSVADTVILPMQDILGLGAKGRMNRPSTTRGNWEWRLLSGQLTPDLARSMEDLTKLYGRG